MIEIHRYSTFFFTGCGHPNSAMWLNILRIIGLMVPFSLLALYFRSLNGVFVARLAADLLAGGIAWYCAHRLTRRLLAESQKKNLSLQNPDPHIKTEHAISE